jgi:hypothetical protein
MSIELDTWTFRRLIDTVMPGEFLTPAEARTVLQIAQLAAGIDLDDDAAERGLLGSIARQLCAHAGALRSSVPAISPLPGDAEERRWWIESFASQLETTRARELAFVLAYLLIIADFELAPVETELLEGLRAAFAIDADRAADLLLQASEIITPGVPGDLIAAPVHP